MGYARLAVSTVVELVVTVYIAVPVDLDVVGVHTRLLGG